MDKLTQLRLAETMEEEAFGDEDMIEMMNGEKSKDYREEYKEFYSDIKLSVKEDW